MASTTFIDQQTIIYAAWLNDVNNAVYNGIFIASSISPANLVCNGSVSGTGFTGLVNNTLSAPGQIGNATPNTGAFTTLTATTPVAVSSGGTGLATLTANNVLLGNGTSSPSFVAPSTSGNVLTSNGTTWSSQPIPNNGIAKAWVNFDSSGNIVKSFNVSSVTRTATGYFTITLTNTQTDANYAILVTPRTTDTNNIRIFGYVSNNTITTTSFGVIIHNLSSYIDPTNCYVVVFD